MRLQKRTVDVGGEWVVESVQYLLAKQPPMSGIQDKLNGKLTDRRFRIRGILNLQCNRVWLKRSVQSLVLWRRD